MNIKRRVDSSSVKEIKNATGVCSVGSIKPIKNALGTSSKPKSSGAGKKIKGAA
jgi:hypothetical protein